jgi:hypothetical protein
MVLDRRLNLCTQKSMAFASTARLHHLFDLGRAAGLYPAKETIGRGRKPKHYEHLNPNDPAERALLLLKVL